MLLQILVLVVLVGLNAFFASSEIAIISLNDVKIRKMAKKGDKKAVLINKMIAEPSRFFATIQVGVTFAGLLASAFASESFADKLTTLILNMGLGLNPSFVKSASVILITFILSYFTLVFGELVPKRAAIQKPEFLSMIFIKPLNIFLKVAAPFVKFLSFSTNFIIKLFGGNPKVNRQDVTEEEIRMMVDLGEEKGVIPGSEKQMIENIFEFDNKFVSEIMTHRKHVEAIPSGSTLDEVMKKVKNVKFTRLPVYDGTIDDITGILHVKDLLQFMVTGGISSTFDLNNILRSPFFVPMSKKTDKMLREMQKRKTHIAVVIDEYGGTAGIVTIEDLVEEIVGNIQDEYDREPKDIVKKAENTYMVSGTAELETINDYFNIKLPLDVYDTLSGFIIGQLGRIPGEDEKPVVEYAGMVFKVEDISEKRITSIKVCRSS